MINTISLQANHNNIGNIELPNLNDTTINLGQKSVLYSTASIPSFFSRMYAFEIAFKEVCSRDGFPNQNSNGQFQFNISDLLVSEYLDILELLLFTDTFILKRISIDSSELGQNETFKNNIINQLKPISFGSPNDPVECHVVKHTDGRKLGFLIPNSLKFIPSPGVRQVFETDFPDMLPLTQTTKNQVIKHLKDRNRLKDVLFASKQYLTDINPLLKYIEKSAYTGYNAASTTTYNLPENFTQNWFYQYLIGSIIEDQDIDDYFHLNTNSLYSLQDYQKNGNWISGNFILPLKSEMINDEISIYFDESSASRVAISINNLTKNFNFSAAERCNIKSFSIFPNHKNADNYEINTVGDQLYSVVLTEVRYNGDPILSVVDNNNSTEIGVIIPNLRPIEENRTPVDISIDFGTSNTYICIKDANDNINSLSVDNEHPLAIGMWVEETKKNKLNTFYPLDGFKFPIPTLMYEQSNKIVFADPLAAADDNLISNIKWTSHANIYLIELSKIIKAALSSNYTIQNLYYTFPALQDSVLTEYTNIYTTAFGSIIDIKPVSESIAPLADTLRNRNANIQQNWLLNIDIGGGSVDYIIYRSDKPNVKIASLKYGANFVWLSKTLNDLKINNDTDLQSFVNSNAFVRSTRNLQRLNSVDRNSSKLLFLFSADQLSEERETFINNFNTQDIGDIATLKKGMMYHLQVVLKYAGFLIESTIEESVEMKQDMIVTFSGAGSQYINLLFAHNSRDGSRDKWLNNYLSELLSYYSDRKIVINNNSITEQFISDNPKEKTGRGAFFASSVGENRSVIDILSGNENTIESDNDFYDFKILYGFKLLFAKDLNNNCSRSDLYPFINIQDFNTDYIEGINSFQLLNVPYKENSQFVKNISDLFGFRQVGHPPVLTTTNPPCIWRHVEKLAKILQ